jgi:hypothetical protein
MLASIADDLERPVKQVRRRLEKFGRIERAPRQPTARKSKSKSKARRREHTQAFAAETCVA